MNINDIDKVYYYVKANENYGKFTTILKLHGLKPINLTTGRDSILFFNKEERIVEFLFDTPYVRKQLEYLGYKEIQFHNDDIVIMDNIPFPKYMIIDNQQKYVIGKLNGQYIVVDKDEYHGNNSFNITLVDDATDIVVDMSLSELVEYAQKNLDTNVRLKI